MWPDAHAGKLRAAATTWRTVGQSLEAIVDHHDLVISALREEVSPEIPVAIGVVRELKGSSAPRSSTCCTTWSATRSSSPAPAPR